MKQLTPIIILGLLLLGVNANATTAYFSDKGKRLSKGQAIVMGLKKPGSRFLKIQVNYVSVNPEKASLKKLSDAPLKSACEVSK